MREIKLTKGMVALISDEDYDRVSALKWCVSQEGRNGAKFYAIRGRRVDGKWKKIRMHHFILGVTSDTLGEYVVDHIDGDGLNNQRENLQVITRVENMARAPGWRGSLSKWDPLSRIDF
jgi:hypothetical protein